MPLRIFTNKNNQFTPADLPHSTGLWQSLRVTDVNGDGKADLLAGNWGYNSKLHAGKNGPVKLYVKDFDKNGSMEQIMACTIDGKEYTFLGKDELERALPVLKKAYLTYGEVAGQTVQYLFYDLFKDYLELQAETLATSVAINDGKGGFTLTALPAEAQLAPVFAWAAGKGNLPTAAAGNFFGTVPYEGRYDALCPLLMNYNKNTKNFAVKANLPGLSGEYRDASWIIVNHLPALLMARNNATLQLWQYKP